MKTTITIIAVCFFAMNISAQEVVSSAGESFDNGNIQVDFTLGEMVTETYSSGIILTQGFHQPTVGPNSILELQLESYELYPNPTTDWIQLSIDDQQNKAGIATIINLKGSVVLQQNLADVSSARISVEHLASGSYFLQLSIDNGSINYQPISIQKHN